MGDIEDTDGMRLPAATPQLRSSLLSWYDHHHRVLPWRRNSHSKLPASAPEAGAARWPTAPGGCAPLAGLSQADFAYGVFVSELMLQQTQVERVRDYFVRWMARWPTLRDLAAASEEDVNAQWAGLGYYRRARFLLQGARYAVEHNGGELPSTAHELLKVPGIGPYTAASVASIAFAQPCAAVDGNVVRVVSRLYALAQDNPTSSAAVKDLQRLADGLLEVQRPGDWNQAVMELGATVCTPRAARCAECPVAAWCGALRRTQTHAGALVTDYPVKPKKAARRVEAVHVRVVEWRDTSPAGARWLLMLRRPDGGLLGGQWEFPSAASSVDEPVSTRSAELDDTLAWLGLPEANAGAQQCGGELAHVFSHVEHRMHVEAVVLEMEAAPRNLAGAAHVAQPTWRWVLQPADCSEPAAMTSGVRKAWAAVFQPKVSEVKSRKRRTPAADE
jgi:A/G-specific adenine glycosylase